MNKKYPFKSDFLAPRKMHFKKLLTFMNRNEIYKKVPSKKSNFLKWMNWKVFFFKKESFFPWKKGEASENYAHFMKIRIFTLLFFNTFWCVSHKVLQKNIYLCIVFLNECQTYAQMANIDVHYRDLGVWNESTKILINPCFCK